MLNSEGYRDDLGAAQARNAELEKELKELRNVKAPDVAAHRAQVRRVRFVSAAAAMAVIVIGSLFWFIVFRDRSSMEDQMTRMRGRIGLFRAENAVLQDRHRVLYRQVEDQIQVLAKLRQESERTVVETPPVRVSASSAPAGNLSADVLAQRLALCQRLDITRSQLYVEGVIIRRGFNASMQPNPTRRDELEPVSIRQAITVLLPDRSEVTIRRSLCLRQSCFPHSFSNPTRNPTLNPDEFSETDLYEEAFWAELQVGDIVGLTFENLRDRNVINIRTTSK